MEGIAALVRSPAVLVLVWGVLIVIILGIFGVWAFKSLYRYVIKHRELELPIERVEKAKEEAKETKERAIIEVEERAEGEAEEEASPDLYEGMAKLAIAPPVDYDQMRELEEYLRQVEHLRLVLVGGSVKEGNKILVFTQKPIPLINVLGEIPLVEQVVKSGKDIRVTLRAR